MTTNASDSTATTETEDRLAILELIGRLALSLDGKDWDALERLFTDPVHLDRTSLWGGDPETYSPERSVRRADRNREDVGLGQLHTLPPPPAVAAEERPGALRADDHAIAVRSDAADRDPLEHRLSLGRPVITVEARHNIIPRADEYAHLRSRAAQPYGAKAGSGEPAPSATSASSADSSKSQLPIACRARATRVVAVRASHRVGRITRT